jgi:mono/diheme cytochrome c family protein
LINLAAEQLGYTAEMVERSAAARAKADGVSIEDVLRSWTGAAPAPTAAAPPAAPAAESAPAPPAAPDETPAEPAPTGGLEVEVLEPATTAAPAEEEEAGEEPAEQMPPPAEPEVAGGFPRWLAAAFIIVSLIAVMYALIQPNGPDCGSAGQLALDPETGEAVNCDGSAYGSDLADFFTVGQSIYDARCAACHGAGGGGGAGPAFTNGAVLVTFSACTDHIEWIVLGTAGWPDPTYGDTAKPVGGGGIMPGFPNLTPQEVASVSLYERVAFGGADLVESEAACGLSEGDVAAP